MSDLGAWTRLTGLVTDDPGVLPQVVAAVTDPAGYLAAHEDALLERGIEEPDEVTGIIALIDALMVTGEVAYVDWKEDAAEVRAQLAALPRVRATGVMLDGSLPGNPEQVAAGASAQLADVGLVVLGLDEGSDAYALVVVPTSVASQALAAGAALDDVVLSFG